MSALLKIDQLEKSYQMPAGILPVLKGIDAVFSEAEMVSIVGASGVGKSTLLHVVGTLDRPTGGSILYRNHDTNEWVNPFTLNDAKLAFFRNRMIGFVFQFHYLLPEFSALENVVMPGLIATDDRMLKSNGGRKGLYEKAEKLLDEMSLRSRMHHKPGELSGGEQQRVAVARALIREPKVVLADEPTGNLDNATGEGLFSLLLDINARRGITFIIVTHNQSLSRRCHRTLEMVDGRFSNGKQKEEGK